jgi:predicted methyltransferase
MKRFLLLIFTILGMNIHAQDVKFLNHFDSVRFYERVNCTYEDTVPSEFWIDEERRKILYFNEKRQCKVYKYTKKIGYERFNVYFINDPEVSQIKIIKDHSMIIFINKDKRTIFLNEDK